MKTKSCNGGANVHGTQFSRGPFSKTASPRTGEAHVRAAVERVTRALVGLGERYMGFRDRRLHIPTDILRKIGGRPTDGWMATNWMNECVRMVPWELWSDYLNVVRAELDEKASPRAFSMLVERSALAIHPDRRGRWEIPKHLVVKAELVKSSPEVVLVANRFWIEVWGCDTWDAMQESLMARTKAAGPLPRTDPTEPGLPRVIPA